MRIYPTRKKSEKFIKKHVEYFSSFSFLKMLQNKALELKTEQHTFCFFVRPYFDVFRRYLLEKHVENLFIRKSSKKATIWGGKGEDSQTEN